MSDREGAIVLLSAGLDSTVNLAKAISEFKVDLAITFDYGQVAAEKEMSRSRLIARKYGVSHRSIELRWMADYSKSGLFSGLVPALDPDDLSGPAAKESAKAVWVPNRNGLFVSLAAAIAEGVGSSKVVAGFNAEEAATFPDNSVQFVKACNELLSISTLSRVELMSFTQEMAKEEIVKLGNDLNIPWDLIWVCYLGEEKMCGKCESCLRLKKALQLANLEKLLDRRFNED